MPAGTLRRVLFYMYFCGMKHLIPIVGILLLASCHMNVESNVQDTTDDCAYIGVRSPKEDWEWQAVVDSTNPDFPDFPDPRYMEYFLKYDEYGGMDLTTEFDTLNILLFTEGNFAGLPQKLCGIPARYYRNWEELDEKTTHGSPSEIQELDYEIRTDTNGNPILFIGVYFITYIDTDDMVSSHTFAEQNYIDSVLQSHRRK